jgi:hypothetical protein
METEERDATSRASFKCPSCCKTFTDLEVNHFIYLCFCNFCSSDCIISHIVIVAVKKAQAVNCNQMFTG